MRLPLASIAFISAVSFSAPSLAATVDSIQGSVSINRGDGYQRVSAPTQITAGDLIMASPEGSAELVYYDDCRVTVQPGAVMTIAREPPCATSAMMRLGAGSLKDTPPVFIDEAPDFSLGRKILVGGLIVGGIVAAVLLLQEDEDRERSP